MDFPARHLWSPDGNIPINQPWLGVVLTHLCQQGGMRYNPMSMNLYLYWEWFLALGLQHYVLFKNRGADSREIKHCWLENDPLLDCSNRNKLGCIFGLQPPTEFWKWKKVRAPQLAEKVGDRNQDKRLATLRTFKKKNFGNSNFQILIL